MATSEIRYGDNDRLAARVAQCVGADGVRGLSLLETSVEIRPVAEADGGFAARLAEALKSGGRK